MKKIQIEYRRWIYSTVIVGALPLIVRLLINCLLTVKTDRFNPIDFVFLGLTLSLTNINELNSLKKDENTQLSYKEDSVWVSIFTILFLTFILGVQYVGESMEKSIVSSTAVISLSVIFAVISLIHSGTIMYKLKSTK